MSRKLLNIPVAIWIAQITYAIFAMALLYVLVKTLKPTNLLHFEIGYVIIMATINVTWRIIVQRSVK